MRKYDALPKYEAAKRTGLVNALARGVRFPVNVTDKENAIAWTQDWDSIDFGYLIGKHGDNGIFPSSVSIEKHIEKLHTFREFVEIRREFLRDNLSPAGKMLAKNIYAKSKFLDPVSHRKKMNDLFMLRLGETLV